AGEKVDAAVIEVGMGGRLDPTNIVSPTVCAIGAIGMDHTQFLGETIEAIAGEKAGIIKPGVPVVAHPAEEGVAAVFARAASEKNAPLRQMTREMILRSECDAHGTTADYQLKERWQDVRIALPGAHQVTNAMTVLALVEELRAQGWQIPDKAVYTGLARAKWPARLEWCGSVLLDGAHNAQGIAALADFVQTHLADKRRVLLTGVLTEKLDDRMLRTLASLGEIIITVTPDTPRAMTAQELAARFASVGAQAEPQDDLSVALDKARALAGEDGVVIASGSLYLMGSLRTALGLEWR
ncbi:MAG: bifunctional folylpolyglutamate synthase/dihydrofolate synthase, partial [Clostridia bacterium]|nr:bifunctional folylpolyglutamate synthase/dihydrofolate synthase [Clostridia bacterium]